MIVNSFLVCIDHLDFEEAAYFASQMNNIQFNEGDAFENISKVYCNNLIHLVRTDDKKDIPQIRNCIDALTLANCNSTAKKFRKYLDMFS